MNQLTTRNLIHYRIAWAGQPLSPLTALKYEILVTAQGLVLRAQRAGLHVVFPLLECASPLPGLAPVPPAAQLGPGRIPLALLQEALAQARAACASPRLADFRESLFFFTWDTAGNSWQLHCAPQERHAARVRALDDRPDSAYGQALVELHTHPPGADYFSARDDAEERGKFRIFVVACDIHTTPRLRLRVGVFEHFYEIPAAWVFDLS